jgi:hypothetical protein
VKRTAQVLLLVLTGLGLLHTALFTDLYLRYVKEGLRPLLIISGALLLLLGLAHAALDRGSADEEKTTTTATTPGNDPDMSHGHDHSTAPASPGCSSSPRSASSSTPHPPSAPTRPPTRAARPSSSRSGSPHCPRPHPCR